MGVLLKRKRLAANPHRKRRRNAGAVKRVNRQKNKKRLTAKQIKFFGTKAQRAALKRRRNGTAKRNRRNPVKRVNHRLRTKRRSNPAWVVTLGAINPRRKKRRNKPVAARKANRRRRRNTTVRRVNRHHRRRRNPVAAPRRRNRRRNPVARATNRRRRRNSPRIIVMRPNRHRRHARRRNPSMDLFGTPLFGKNGLEMVGGGFVGLVAAKFIPTLFPASITAGIAGTSVGRIVISGISAVLAGWAGSKVSPIFGQGVLFGGMVQTASIALNAFLPTAYASLNPSLGDLLPGQFTVPQNPIRAAIAPPAPPVTPPASAQTRTGSMNGLARAYGSAY